MGMPRHVRLDHNASDPFLAELGSRAAAIQKAFTLRLNTYTAMAPVNVMFKDGTVDQQETFDPELVRRFLERVVSGLDGWIVHGVSESNNEDVRRLFVKFDITEGRYRLSGHLSIQFHVLLYYKPDRRVMECQRELAGLFDSTNDYQQKIAEVGNHLILKRLKEMGQDSLDHQDLFEMLYQDDTTREELYQEAATSTGSDLASAERRRASLLQELDDLLLETYQTSPVLIDDVRLVAGEEGHLCVFDLEYNKGGTSQGLFDPARVPARIRDALKSCLVQIACAIDQA